METIKEDVKFNVGDIVMVGTVSPAQYIAGERNIHEHSQVELHDMNGDYVTTVNTARVSRNITAEAAIAIVDMCAL